jgi:hypothetical protein
MGIEQVAAFVMAQVPYGSFEDRHAPEMAVDDHFPVNAVDRVVQGRPMAAEFDVRQAVDRRVVLGHETAAGLKAFYEVLFTAACGDGFRGRVAMLLLRATGERGFDQGAAAG